MIRHLSEHFEAFDPATIRTLIDAFESAWLRVEASTISLGISADDARPTLVSHIVDIANTGVRDRQHLIDGALVRFCLPFLCGRPLATYSFYEVLMKPRGPM
jgi:hypothetical protein